jgi:radical SAM protein with 4Fe4S-binding SPASM domain
MASYIPINKGNYALDTPEREAEFERKRAGGHPEAYGEYRRLWSELPRAQVVRDYPILVDLELASVCNLKCPMCYTITPEFKRKVNATLMKFQLFQKIIHEIQGKVYSVRLSLRGESLLHPRFLDAIRCAKQAGILEVSTLTNGSKLESPEFCRSLVEAGLDWITVSADGIGPIYDSIRAPITYEKIVQNLRILQGVKRDLGSEKPVVKVQTIWPAIQADPGAYLEAFTPLSDLVAFNPLIDYVGEIPSGELLFEPDFTCPMPYQRLVIGADGTVMMCSNDEENSHPVGNANRQSVHEIWHGPAMQEVRRLHRDHAGVATLGPCSHCYLPRKTRDDVCRIGERDLVVKNYLTVHDVESTIKRMIQRLNQERD